MPRSDTNTTKYNPIPDARNKANFTKHVSKTSSATFWCYVQT